MQLTWRTYGSGPVRHPTSMSASTDIRQRLTQMRWSNAAKIGTTNGCIPRVRTCMHVADVDLDPESSSHGHQRAIAVYYSTVSTELRCKVTVHGYRLTNHTSRKPNWPYGYGHTWTGLAAISQHWDTLGLRYSRRHLASGFLDVVLCCLRALDHDGPLQSPARHMASERAHGRHWRPRARLCPRHCVT
jgi:hypothetical protein